MYYINFIQCIWFAFIQNFNRMNRNYSSIYHFLSCEAEVFLMFKRNLFLEFKNNVFCLEWACCVYCSQHSINSFTASTNPAQTPESIKLRRVTWLDPRLAKKSLIVNSNTKIHTNPFAKSGFVGKILETEYKNSYRGASVSHIRITWMVPPCLSTLYVTPPSKSRACHQIGSLINNTYYYYLHYKFTYRHFNLICLCFFFCFHYRL